MFNAQDKPQIEIVDLHSPGPIPGIPGGTYGPGRFLIDWAARTVTPIDAEPATETQPDMVQSEQEEVPAAPEQSEQA
jgi:hypothetical protein